MKENRIHILIILIVLILPGCSSDKAPFKLVDGYMYIQNENRRNDSTEWKMVWQDDFTGSSLDTNTWSRIDLFTSPKWAVPK